MRLLLRQISGEFRKLFARKRTYIGFGAFLLLELVILVLLGLPPIQKTLRGVVERTGYDPESYLSGLTLALLIVAWTVFLLEALYLALVAGDVVSKEVEDGSLRMMLCRPISRARIIGVKAFVSFVYTFALTIFVMATALVAGLLNRGPGGLLVLDPANQLFVFHEFMPGLWRYLAAFPLLSVSLCTITAVAFCLSCFNMKPAAATVITLSILFVDSILKNIPYFASIRGWFLTEKMAAWLGVFQYHIPWTAMIESYSWLFAINATLLIVGWQVFERRDFKS